MQKKPGASAGGVPFDIKDRTFQFGVRTVRLANRLPPTVAGTEIARQIIRAGTSIGSNMQEADAAVSKRDLVNGVRISRKEAREVRYWLSIIQAVPLLEDPEVGTMIQESSELVRILSGIIRSATGQSTR